MQPNMTQTARAVQAQGRGNDSMLVHMTPKEVGGLQALAMANGGSLTINPETGLPEAGFLENLLPTLIGVGLSFIPGVGPMAAGMITGGIETVRTGDIGKGFLAGLGAYGGASMAGGLQSAGTAANAANAANVSTTTANAANVIDPATYIGETGAGALSTGAPATMNAGSGVSSIVDQGDAVAKALTPTQQLTTGFKSVFDTGPTGQAARDAFMGKVGGYGGLAKTAGMAGAPLIVDAMTPKAPEMPKEEESNYAGPYTPTRRTVRYPTDDERRRTSEFTYFTPSNPVPFAEGGETAAPTSSADVLVSPNEARVYQDIINVQRLAGLPSLDPNRFAVAPGRSYEQFVYNPIENMPLGQATGETNYGFVPRSASDANPAISQGLMFFRPKENTTSGSIVNRVGRMAGDLLGIGGNPDDYETFMPSGRVDMANYYYDPALGGYVAKSDATKFNYMMPGGLNFSKGGSVPQLEDGGFVLTKKAVDGLGRGSNKKGQENARRGLGAIPIKGPGTGTSDSIKTNIDGKRPALVSNGEAYVPKRQVAKRGGAKAFYALMNKAEKAADRRKRA